MRFHFETSDSSIGKSGTGIQKSGTGIQKGGTGIGRSGPGVRFGFMLVLVVTLFTAGTVSAANDVRMLVSQYGGHLMISIHNAEGIVAGHVRLNRDAGDYQQVPIFPVSVATDNGPRVQYHGSGSGSPEYHGSGSGSPQYHGSGSGSPQYHGSGSGSPQYHGSGSGSPEYHGSGSGAAGEAVCDFGSIAYHGSGSGSPEYHGSGSGSPEYHGSGSGAAGEGISACEAMGLWGFAEVVLDARGMHVIVHRLQQGVFAEHLVGFVGYPEGQIDPDTGKAFISAP